MSAVSKRTFEALSKNMAAAKTTRFWAVAAITTEIEMSEIPTSIETSRLLLSINLPMTGERSPANSPTMNATPICPTDTSRPRAITAMKGGANR